MLASKSSFRSFWRFSGERDSAEKRIIACGGDMRLHLALCSSVCLFLLGLCSPDVLADRREIAFSTREGTVTAFATNLGFVHSGKIGVVLTYKQNPYSTTVVSFSVAEGRIVDSFDLVADFGVTDNFNLQPISFLKTHDLSGLVTIYGRNIGGIQKLLALTCDETGHLRRLWIRSFSSASRTPSENWLASNEDGSRIYFLHQRSGGATPQPLRAHGYLTSEGIVDLLRLQRLAYAQPILKPNQGSLATIEMSLDLIDVQTGGTLGTADVTGSGILSAVFFDGTRRRPTVLSGTVAYVFVSASDSLVVESRFAPQLELSLLDLEGQGLSQDGRLLAAYGGYNFDESGKLYNIYVSYNLEERSTTQFAAEGTSLIPFSNGAVFHRPTATLLVPLQIKFISEGNTIELKIVGSRQIDILKLAASGSFSRPARVEIPKRSEGSVEPNMVGPLNTVAISATGAVGFASSSNGRLFTFDMLSGQIVGDDLLESGKIFEIQLLESQGLLVYSNAENKLVFVDVSAGPTVTSVKVKNNRTIIKGATFLVGARVEINGVDLGVVNRSPDDPSREIVLDKGKRDFPASQPFNVVVINRDGLRSKPFPFQR